MRPLAQEYGVSHAVLYRHLCHRNVRRSRRNGEWRQCLCGNTFYVPKHRLLEAKYCSRQCTGRFRGPVPKRVKPRGTCLWCGEPLRTPPSVGRKFCSGKCFHAWYSKNLNGPNSKNWRGGTRWFRGLRWRQIADRVKRRDGYACVRCGNTQRLDAHHLLDLRKGGTNHLYNLVTLCNKCHHELEWKKRKGIRDVDTIKYIHTPVG